MQLNEQNRIKNALEKRNKTGTGRGWIFLTFSLFLLSHGPLTATQGSPCESLSLFQQDQH